MPVIKDHFADRSIWECLNTYNYNCVQKLILAKCLNWTCFNSVNDLEISEKCRPV